MKLALPGRSLRLAGWALPLLVWLCCAPSAARASCGDYVVTRAPHSGDMTAAAHPAADGPLQLSASPHKPCHGPNCSGNPTVPQPLSAPTVTPPVPPEWGWLVATPPPAPPGGGTCLAPSASSHPTHLASSIFHPPRSAA